MGVAFSILGFEQDYEEKASWSYGGFTDFRARLAEQVGIQDIREMEGYFKYAKGKSQSAKNIVMGVKEWPKSDDPIFVFLHGGYHGEDDVSLTPKQCARIAPRLRELAHKCGIQMSGYVLDYDEKMALRLADQMETAARLGKKLVYS